jgi:FixJ family two-component response regulator
MERVVDEWKALVCGLTRLLSSRRRYPEGARQKAPRILALVPPGPNRLLLQTISRDAGWALTLSETAPGIAPGRQSDVPPIIIYDRELSPYDWREIVHVLAKKSPRPYVILLSPNADTNLWDELQRVGGSDILRTPINRDTMLRAVKRAWLLWRNQQQVRSPSQNRL